VNNVPKWAITSTLLILRAALVADRRTYGFAGGAENLGAMGTSSCRGPSWGVLGEAEDSAASG